MIDTATEPHAPPERVWSISAADLYRRCPQWWSYRYGPHRVPARGGAGVPLHKAQGIVLHGALAAAYRAADAELEATPGGLAGARMDRYWAAARAELGRTWTASGMPGDPNVARETVALLRGALAGLDVPARGALYAIERKITHRTPAGVPVVAYPDLTMWARPGVLRIRDWKTGAVTMADVLASQQLPVYAFLLADADPEVVDVEIELYSIRHGVSHVHPPTEAEVAEAVVRLEDTALKANADDQCEPDPGPACVGCPFIRICPAHEEAR